MGTSDPVPKLLCNVYDMYYLAKSLSRNGDMQTLATNPTLHTQDTP